MNCKYFRFYLALMSSQSNSSHGYPEAIYPATYFFTIDSPMKYMLCFTYEITGLYFLNLYWIGVDTLFAQLTAHASIQFEVIDIINEYDEIYKRKVIYVYCFR